MTPKISVVTPCRNMARFLEECMESVFSQAYDNTEYIVIDGGSTDSTIEILKRNEHRLSYWIIEPDNGQSHAINKGLARATGELVCWLNADDYFLPGALRRVANAYARNPNAPFYFGDGLRVDENGIPKAGFFPGRAVHYSEAALLKGLNYILQPAAVINRRYLDEIGPLNEALHFGMDSDLWMRLAKLGRPQPIQAQLAASREYERTKTMTGSFGRVDELRQISKAHTGLEMTPGVLCYFYDELLRYSDKNPELFSPEFRRRLCELWEVTSKLFQRFGARPDGFPIQDDR